MSPDVSYFPSLVIAAAGLMGVVINIFGVLRGVEVKDIPDEAVHFRVPWPRPTYRGFLQALRREDNEDLLEFTSRLNRLVAARIVHIHWQKYPPNNFNQRIPLYENWVLWLLGSRYGHHAYRRYHYTFWKRSCKRGIGVCGDKSMVLEQLLKRSGIPCKLVSFPGHVIVEAEIEGERYCFDPDYGVLLPFASEAISTNWSICEPLYLDVGASASNVAGIKNIFGLRQHRWADTLSFVRKRYVVEHLGYGVKWVIPIALAVASLAYISGPAV